MNRLFIVISLCLYSSFSHAMEQPTPIPKKYTKEKLQEAQTKLLDMFKDSDGTFARRPIIENTIDFLPYFLAQCLDIYFIPEWTPLERLHDFYAGYKELRDCRTQSFDENIAPCGKKLNRLKEKAIERANNYFTQAAQPFAKWCYIRLPRNGEPYWQLRTMYFTPALYAQAYTALALTEYNSAHDSLIKAIRIDNNYMIGGMSIELLMVLAFTFKYQPSQQYTKEHNLIEKLTKEHLPMKKNIIQRTGTHTVAVANVLSKIKNNEAVIKEENTRKELQKISRKLVREGFSVFATGQYAGDMTLVLDKPQLPKPLTGSQKRKEKRKVQKQKNNKK